MSSTLASVVESCRHDGGGRECTQALVAVSTGFSLRRRVGVRTRTETVIVRSVRELDGVLWAHESRRKAVVDGETQRADGSNLAVVLVLVHVCCSGIRREDRSPYLCPDSKLGPRRKCAWGW